MGCSLLMKRVRHRHRKRMRLSSVVHCYFPSGWSSLSEVGIVGSLLLIGKMGFRIWGYCCRWRGEIVDRMLSPVERRCSAMEKKRLLIFGMSSLPLSDATDELLPSPDILHCCCSS
ncbi:hypothetical protein ACLOJK_024254 [Asimina triloba]